MFQTGKNGLYSNLVRNVKEAFEECELVRINCKDMNNSDCRKIGAKLRVLNHCHHYPVWYSSSTNTVIGPGFAGPRSVCPNII